MEPPSSEGRAAVWLVEDSALEAEVAKRALSPAYEVAHFAEGAAMLERLAVEPTPFAIILDWRLPGLSGLEVCKFIRATWNQNALPILMLTGLSERADLVDAISAGANDYLTKPYDTAELLARVATVVRTRILNDKLEKAEAREREARTEAQAANLAKDEFLAMTSHELRTPLNAILGWANLMRTGQLDPSGYFRAVETIERNAKTQGKLIEDILDCSRIISGRLRLEKERLNFGGVIKSALESVAPLVRKKGVELSVELDPEATQVAGDAERLQQVAWNLVSNAIKFTPKGGRIEVRLERDGELARLSIDDDGEGIDPSFLPHVFERFRQGQGSTTRRHGGLGLGLAVVRHLVDAHGGSVSAASRGVGKGATFVVTLPILKSSDKAVSERPTPTTLFAEVRLDGTKVLVVDDEIDSREFLAAALRMRGADVTIADSAESALRLLDEVQPRVVVSDIGMPRVDGLEFIRAVRDREAENGGRAGALAVSAYARDEDRQRALEAGFNEYLSKPVSPESLTAAVAELASRYHEDSR
jgi:signal transduction histidine kinase